jgi:hypothetical protein
MRCKCSGTLDAIAVYLAQSYVKTVYRCRRVTCGKQYEWREVAEGTQEGCHED